MCVGKDALQNYKLPYKIRNHYKKEFSLTDETFAILHVIFEKIIFEISQKLHNLASAPQNSP